MSIEQYDNLDFKSFQKKNHPDDQLQIDWVQGLVEQIEFANRPDVLPDYVLRLDIRRRWQL